MNKISMTKRELSCFIGNLFAELDTPCGKNDEQTIIIRGTTVTGNYAELRIDGDVIFFDGSDEDLKNFRKGKCIEKCKRSD
jgi:hypothetical protein